LATPTVSSIPTTAPAVSGTVSANADYAAQVDGGGDGAAVAVSVHGKKAVAYVCDGHKVGHWFNGTVKNGKLDLAGQNGAHVTLNYRSSPSASTGGCTTRPASRSASPGSPARATPSRGWPPAPRSSRSSR
jgi:hypothetical protein